MTKRAELAAAELARRGGGGMSAPEKMSDAQIAGVLGFSVMTPNAIAYLAMGRAIEAARDAQWQSRLDAAVMAEQRRICAVIQSYPEWIGRTAKEDLCLAILHDVA